MAEAVRQLSSLTVSAQAEGDAAFVAKTNAMAGALDNLDASAKAAAGGLAVTDTKVGGSVSGYERLTRAIDPAYAAQQKFAAGEKVLQRAFDTGAISAETHKLRVEQLAAKYAAAGGNVVAFSQAATRGQNSSRQMGVAVQQAGYQVGDFAVQVASGQGVLRPFIQQGTQLVSMFGPWGAVIGAAGAVVGAFATAVFGAGQAAGASSDALTLLDDATKKLNEDMGKGNESARQAAFFNLRNAEALEAQARAAIYATEAQLAKNEADLAATSIGAMFAGNNPLAEKLGMQIDAGRSRLEDLRGEADQVSASITKLRGDLSGLGSDYVAQAAKNEQLLAALGVSRHEYDVTAKTQEMLAGKFAGTEEQARALAETLVDQKDKLDKLTGAGSAAEKQALKNSKAANDNLAQVRLQAEGTLYLAAAYGISTAEGLKAQAELQAREAHLKNAATDEKALTAALLDQVRANQALAAAQELATQKQNTHLAAARAQAAAILDPQARHDAELQIARQERLNQLQQQYSTQLEKIPGLMAEFDLQQASNDQARFWNDARQMAAGYADDVKGFILDGLTGATNNGKSIFRNMWDAALAGGKRFLINFALELAKQKFVMPVLMDIIGGNSGLFGIVQAAGGSGGAGAAGGAGGLSSLSSLSSISGLFSNGGMLSGVGSWVGGLFGAGASSATSAMSAATASQIAAGGASGSLAGASSGVASAAYAIPVWGWVAAGAAILKGFVEGAETNSAKGALSTLLLPSIDEWQNNPGRSIYNAFNPVGLVARDFGAPSWLAGAFNGIDPFGEALTSLGLPSFLTPGGLIGSLLGMDKQPSNKYASVPIDAAAGTLGKMQFDPSEYSKANVDAATALGQAYLDIQKQILAQTGGTGPNAAFATVGSRDGITVGVGPNADFWKSHYGGQAGVVEGTFTSPEKALEFMIQQFVKQVKGVEDPDYKRILAKGGTAQEIVDNLNAAAQIKSFSQTDDINKAVDQLKALNQQFADLRDKAVALGLATVDLDKAQKSQLDSISMGLRVNFASKVQDYIGAFLAPLQALQDSISVSGQTSYDKFLAAQSLFRDVAAKAGQGNEMALSMLAAAGANYADLARNMESSTEPLRSWLDSLNSGSLSNLTPRQQLAAAQSKFNDLGARADAGDASVMQELQAAAQSYLQLARDYGAAGPVYQAALSSITATLNGVIDRFDGAIGNVDSGSVLSEVNAVIGPLIGELKAGQSAVLQGIQPTLDDLNSNFRTQIQTLKDEGVMTRDLLAKIATAAGAIVVPGHAAGGLVNGIGGPTSDSNLRWLSDGEYVNRAASVRRFGVGFFDAINAGYLPTPRSASSNDNGPVVDAIYRAAAMHQSALTELTQAVRELQKENEEMRREMRRTDRRSSQRSA